MSESVLEVNSPDKGGAGKTAYSRTPTSWDAEDDILLMHLKDQQKLGWKEIASHFDNRTPNACQFRWRRLKSGNLKNPPKSAGAIGTPVAASSSSTPPKKRKVKPESAFSTYSPISNATFTGYDNSVTSALAGLNALSNTPSNLLSPANNTNPSTPGKSPSVSGLPSGPVNTTDHPQTFDDPPDVHPTVPPSAGGGYYADISVDPTMNLPHNQPNPHAGLQTPRTLTLSASAQRLGSVSGTASTVAAHLHHNSIIHVRDDRTSFSSARAASVSSLPSKSMNIPHHQLNNLTLAHLPILFGANGSISGPSRNSSISAAAGIVQQASVPSLRNGSIGYFSRSGSIVIPKREEIIEKIKEEKKAKDEKKSEKSLALPWSMEEDELLINRRNRELSFAELSILLPQRTEGEIWSRIDHLEKLRDGPRRSRRRKSSIGLDDDFYDMDDVIGDIDSEDDDDDDDDVLVDDDDLPHTSLRRRRKRRASSAVNPLTVPSLRRGR